MVKRFAQLVLAILAIAGCGPSHTFGSGRYVAVDYQEARNECFPGLPEWNGRPLMVVVTGRAVTFQYFFDGATACDRRGDIFTSIERYPYRVNERCTVQGVYTWRGRVTADDEFDLSLTTELTSPSGDCSGYPGKLPCTTIQRGHFKNASR